MSRFPQLGFVGSGAMPRRMAARLRDAGRVVEEVDGSAVADVSATPAAALDAILVCIPDDAALRRSMVRQIAATILADGCALRTCSVEGTTIDEKRIAAHVENTLMLATALAPVIGTTMPRTSRRRRRPKARRCGRPPSDRGR